MADPRNAYTHDSIPATFARTALPIILLTSVNGLLTVVDAMFLGAFVGPDALTAVTMVFPVSMLMYRAGDHDLDRDGKRAGPPARCEQAR